MLWDVLLLSHRNYCFVHKLIQLLCIYELSSTNRYKDTQICLSLCSSQLISSDADGAIQRAGRFRVENGSSDEVCPL